jgi:hypothetical protein
MITAEEAWLESVVAMESIQTIDQLLEIDTKIKEVMKLPGRFCMVFGPFHFTIAEKICIELEEIGFHARCDGSGRFNEAGEPLVVVQVNWKYFPNGVSRAAPTQKKNWVKDNP